MYDLVMQISREFNNPIIEISENGCCYLDATNETGHIPDTRRMAFHRQTPGGTGARNRGWSKVRAYHAWTRWITSNGPMATRSDTASLT